ncbi:hypothetical protein [Streptomyces sp. NRRL F-5123]|uniref:hypothetical protein n=1 Tax=Streptomyces sp. NRRL F-5123 TaxID=1463856 RepID=UPI0004E19EE4|nr:hypothetical protein [Streptomyces sp. NRRL F-5123]
MRAPHSLAATCVAVSAALLLSACGGSKKDDGKIKDPGADVSTSAPAPTSSSAAPSPTATGVKRPTITSFPADAKDVFEDQHTGDATKDAVLADNQQWVMALDDGIFQGTAATKALSFYTVGPANDTVTLYVNGYLSKNYTWTGTVRFFDRKVTILGTGHASVIYCSDESKAFLKNRKTGKVDNTPTTSDSYVLYNTDLKKNAQGVWQTDGMLQDRGAKQCQP